MKKKENDIILVIKKNICFETMVANVLTVFIVECNDPKVGMTFYMYF